MTTDTGRIDALIDAVEKHLSMDDLLATLAAIRDIDRRFTFPRFHESARYTAARLAEAGCDEAEVVEFAADGETVYADYVMPLAWDVGEATLEIVEPADEARTIIRRSDEPNAVVMWCGPTPDEGLTGRVVFWDELDEDERRAADLTDAFLYTRRKPASLKRAAVGKGALGVIGSYGFEREGEDFEHCVCWNNAWSETAGWAMTKRDEPLPGFNVSPAMGRELERLAAEHPELRLRMTVDARLYDGTIPAVSARMAGEGEDEVVVIGHQFEIGANDNASGCAAIIEAARCIGKMVDAGNLPTPKRSLRFITCSEMYSSMPFTVEQPELMRRLVAGLDLDMICPYNGYDSPMDFYQSPDANAYFGDDLLELIVRRVWDRNGSTWPWERMPTQLSDNCWCDPYVGVPFSWISWHGREFWHSSGDTIDRIVPDAVRDVTTAAITWLAFIATADADDAAWLAGVEQETARERVEAETGERRDYVLARELRRIRSITALAASPEIDRAAEAVAELGEPPEPFPADPDDEGAQLVPMRTCPAPLTFGPIPPAERRFPSPLWNARLNSALYWADGERSIREIEHLIRMEHGEPPNVDLVDWFRFLGEHGYVEFGH
ncbi:MAG: M28 family peptidase [Planctomycetota bacterium]